MLSLLIAMLTDTGKLQQINFIMIHKTFDNMLKIPSLTWHILRCQYNRIQMIQLRFPKLNRNLPLLLNIAIKSNQSQFRSNCKETDRNIDSFIYFLGVVYLLAHFWLLVLESEERYRAYLHYLAYCEI